MYDEKVFLKAISKSYRNYITYGARSNEKLKPIHGYIAQVLRDIYEHEYDIYYLSDETSEYKVVGKYYEKDIDITVVINNKPVLCFGIKFVTSNYKQNSNNYFENMMGETANIQAIKDIPYFQLIILRMQTPYYKKSKANKGTKEPTKIEIINEHDLQKYIKLAYDTPHTHKPYAIGIMLIDINEISHRVKVIKPENEFSDEFATLLINKLSMRHLFEEIQNYKIYLQNKR
jgi:hypothetical protein